MRKFILQRRWIGRFGNRMHQYAYGATYKHRFDVDYYVISSWEGDHLFAQKHHKVIEDDELRNTLTNIENNSQFEQERLLAVQDYSQRLGEPIRDFSPVNANETWLEPNTHVSFDNLCAYEPKIFSGMSKTYLLHEVFPFRDEVKRSDIFKRFEDRQGSYDIAHLRRDDTARTDRKSAYPCLSKESYINAFRKYGVDPVNVEWTTDDYAEKWEVGSPLAFSGKRLGGVYPTGSILDPEGKIFFDWFPDFLRLYFARNIFRANSSFSFWAAFLANQRTNPPTVYAPRIEKYVYYGDPKSPGQEMNCEFVEGNHPHWLSNLNSKCPNIIIE